jgi:pimeloyl-ACP methyl ester carboxylesterase
MASMPDPSRRRYTPGPAARRYTALTPKEFYYAFANTLSAEESNKIYERYWRPGLTTVVHEGAFANFHRNAPTKVDSHREGRAPLLLIGFSEDHVVPPKGIRHNEEKYDNSVTEFKEFEGRPHFPAAPGWEEVADYALPWAPAHAAPMTPMTAVNQTPTQRVDATEFLAKEERNGAWDS